jgi:hypothetical protein
MRADILPASVAAASSAATALHRTDKSGADHRKAGHAHDQAGRYAHHRGRVL